MKKAMKRSGLPSYWKEKSVSAEWAKFGKQATNGARVALKIIKLEVRSALKELRAIRTIRNVNHPNIVPIVDIWLRDTNGNIIEDEVTSREKPEELVIAMGLGEKSLLERLKESQKVGRQGISPDDLIGYMEDAARAIDYLNFPTSESNRPPIQHCDIKPGNILIVRGSAQVCDFGVCVLGGDPRATRTGDHMSVPYTSPELFWDASKPSQWSDQYSLAITYVELRTGSLPFQQTTPAAMMFAHTQGRLDLSKLAPGKKPSFVEPRRSMRPNVFRRRWKWCRNFVVPLSD